ncbi:MAG: hypothetical protein ACREQY_21055, partial [Candidatus Binatia bacterium]
LAQADFKTGTARDLSGSVNFVDVGERSERGIIEALRSGHYYVTEGHLGESWRLEEFRASDGVTSSGSGDVLTTSSPVRVMVRFRRLRSDAPPLGLELIRGGEVVLTSRISDSRELHLDDAAPPRGELRYYRLNAGRRARPDLLANPIFVRGAGAAVGGPR